jgi:hypothetical protein
MSDRLWRACLPILSDIAASGAAFAPSELTPVRVEDHSEVSRQSSANRLRVDSVGPLVERQIHAEIRLHGLQPV